MALNLAGAESTAEIEARGRRITLLDESGKPYMDGDKPVTALIAGSLSQRMTEAEDLANERIKALGATATKQELEVIQREKWATAVIEWDLEIDGDPAVAQIMQLKGLIYNQVVLASTNHASFFVKPLTPSVVT